MGGDFEKYEGNLKGMNRMSSGSYLNIPRRAYQQYAT
jgi:hypothetical protein